MIAGKKTLVKFFRIILRNILDFMKKPKMYSEKQKNLNKRIKLPSS